ncbi:hypothetical protein HDU76_014133 [Blyttiomyces sp. JEL0837]|nr:hypothetical protein HDU76_014133 [Blyttiomyces sp. JEL0837]
MASVNKSASPAATTRQQDFLKPANNQTTPPTPTPGIFKSASMPTEFPSSSSTSSSSFNNAQTQPGIATTESPTVAKGASKRPKEGGGGWSSFLRSSPSSSVTDDAGNNNTSSVIASSNGQLMVPSPSNNMRLQGSKSLNALESETLGQRSGSATPPIQSQSQTPSTTSKTSSFTSLFSRRNKQNSTNSNPDQVGNVSPRLDPQSNSNNAAPIPISPNLNLSPSRSSQQQQQQQQNIVLPQHYPSDPSYPSTSNSGSPQSRGTSFETGSRGGIANIFGLRLGSSSNQNQQNQQQQQGPASPMNQQSGSGSGLSNSNNNGQLMVPSPLNSPAGSLDRNNNGSSGSPLLLNLPVPRHSSGDSVNNTGGYHGMNHPHGSALSAAVLAAVSVSGGLDGNSMGSVGEEGYLFGTGLEVAVERAGRDGVPDIVRICVDHLDRVGLIVEGLYRIPGSAKRVKEWAERFEDAAVKSRPVVGGSGGNVIGGGDLAGNGNGEAAVDKDASGGESVSMIGGVVAGGAEGVSDEFRSGGSGNKSVVGEDGGQGTPTTAAAAAMSLSQETRIPPPTEGPVISFENESPATVASLLKRFIGRIKGGFVGDGSVFRELETLLNGVNVNEDLPLPLISNIRRVIQSHMPTACHLRTFAYFIQHLHRIYLHAEQNKMTAANLAIVTFPTGGTALEALIRIAPQVFEGWYSAGYAPPTVSVSDVATLPRSINNGAGGSSSASSSVGEGSSPNTKPSLSHLFGPPTVIRTPSRESLKDLKDPGTLATMMASSLARPPSPSLRPPSPRTVPSPSPTASSSGTLSTSANNNPPSPMLLGFAMSSGLAAPTPAPSPSSNPTISPFFVDPSAIVAAVNAATSGSSASPATLAVPSPSDNKAGAGSSSPSSTASSAMLTPTITPTGTPSLNNNVPFVSLRYSSLPQPPSGPPPPGPPSSAPLPGPPAGPPPPMTPQTPKPAWEVEKPGEFSERTREEEMEMRRLEMDAMRIRAAMAGGNGANTGNVVAPAMAIAPGGVVVVKMGSSSSSGADVAK